MRLGKLLSREWSALVTRRCVVSDAAFGGLNSLSPHRRCSPQARGLSRLPSGVTRVTQRLRGKAAGPGSRVGRCQRSEGLPSVAVCLLEDADVKWVGGGDRERDGEVTSSNLMSEVTLVTTAARLLLETSHKVQPAPRGGDPARACPWGHPTAVHRQLLGTQVVPSPCSV